MRHLQRFLTYVLLACAPASAMIVNLSFNEFDCTTKGPACTGVPHDAVTAVNKVAAIYDKRFTDPITVNIDVEFDGFVGNNVGASYTSRVLLSYSLYRQKLADDAKSQIDFSAVASLPAVDPLAGDEKVFTTPANARAIGLSSVAPNIPGENGTPFDGV